MTLNRHKLLKVLSVICPDPSLEWYLSGDASYAFGLEALHFSVPSDGYENSKTWQVPLAVSSVQEAWELLATRDLIPMSWVDDPARSFRRVCSFCEGDGRWRTIPRSKLSPRCREHALEGVEDGPCPWTLDMCAALAADVPATLRAEAVAREFNGVRSPLGWIAVWTHDDVATSVYGKHDDLYWPDWPRGMGGTGFELRANHSVTRQPDRSVLVAPRLK